jgi:tetratricopeptide (TPR) repeat protein
MFKYNLDLDYVIPAIDISQEELNEIISEADTIIKENKGNPEKLAVAYLKKAQCLQKLEELKENKEINNPFYKHDDEYKKNQNKIKKLLEKALENIPNMPETLMQMGKYFSNISTSNNKKIDKAIEMYTTAIQLKPDYAAAYNNRSISYGSKVDYMNKNSDWEEHLSFCFISNFIREIMKNIVRARSYSKQINEYYAYTEKRYYEDNSNFLDIWKKAIIDLTEAIRIRHFEPTYFYNRGLNYLKLNDREKATKDFTQAIKYSSDEFKKHTGVFLHLGEVYLEKKYYEKAIDSFSESIRLMPGHHFSLFLRGFAYLMAGKKDDAIADIEEYYCREKDKQPPKPLKCSICGLPNIFIKRDGMRIDDDTWICGKCYKKNELDIKRKLDDKENKLAKKLEDESINDTLDRVARVLVRAINEFSIENCDDRPKLFNNFTMDELRTRAKEFAWPKHPEPVLINNIPIHENRSIVLLEGEIFKKHSKKNVEVSNLGRIKSGDHILKQYDPKKNGYLYVDINDNPEIVYRLVAETWIERPDHSEDPAEKEFYYNTVHHISNNGYDNRIENLMWVTEWQHAMIHPWISLDKFNHEELCLLLESYAEIDITPDDYQRMLDIAQRAYQIGNPPGEGKKYKDYWENIIKPLEDLVRGNIENLKKKKEKLLASGKYKDVFITQIPGETDRFLKWWDS